MGDFGDFSVYAAAAAAAPTTIGGPPKTGSPANANPQRSDKSESFGFLCTLASPACNCWTTEFSSFHYVCTWD